MTLDQLKVLQTILETGGFRAASEKLHRAQSAISYAIRNLESELNVEIFNRDGYRPVLTEAGKAIFEKAKILLLQSEELSRLGKRLAKGQEAEIKLAINAIAPFDPLIEVINRFSKANPSVRIILNVENLSGSVERILDLDADIALTETVGQNDRLVVALWNQIQFLPVASPDFPPSRSAGPIAKSELMQFAQIIVADSSRHSEKQTVGVLAEGIHWTVNDFSIKRKLLISGSGWGMMPFHMIQDDLTDNRLVMLDYPPFSQMIIDFFLARHIDRPLGPLATELWARLLELKGRLALKRRT